jgi:hypothetical protein
VPGWQLGPDGRLKRDEQGNTIWGTRPCNTPLFRFSGARRWSLAEYIAKHAKGAFKLLCADESHEYKGKSSDRGIAFHQLITACQSTLTLTGTFFGGRSTSIFWLLHRLNAGVRHDFAFHDEKRWARLYGVLESQRRRRKSDEEDEDGVFTGNRRYRNQAKEQPGVSPAIVNRLLDTTVFLSLKDLGLALPEYKEEVSTLTMLDDQSQQYHQMDSTLRSMALQSNRYLSTWLQWSLARPNSAFRDETIIVDELNKKGEVIRHVTADGTAGDQPKRSPLVAERGMAGELLSGGKTARSQGVGVRAPDRQARHPGSPGAAAGRERPARDSAGR